MRLNFIIDRFSLISGLKPQEVSKWTPLCVDAKMQIERRVRSGVKLDEEKEIRLSNCAAALAFYKYSLCAPENSVESFSVGTMSVKISAEEKERAKNLWLMEEREAEDLLESEQDFAFVGVAI